MNVLRLSWLPVVERGFCCCGLEMCCRILGYFSVVVHVLATIGFAIFLIISFSNDNDLYKAIGFVTMIAGTVGVVTSIMFTMGVHQGEHTMLLPYVLFLHIELVAAIQGAIYVGLHLPVVSVLFTTPVVALVIYILVWANSLRWKWAQFKRMELVGEAMAEP